MTLKALLTFRAQVTRQQFWTAGGWLLVVWFVGFLGVAMVATAGGIGAAIIVLGWFAYTVFALYTWTALMVGRLRHLRASLWWIMLWPLTIPVLWLVVGVLPAGNAEMEGATRPMVRPPVAAILLAVCGVVLAMAVLLLSTR